MSLALYDNAVLAKVQSWFPQGVVKVIKSKDFGQIISMVADEEGKKHERVTLPIVAITRSGGLTLTDEGTTREAKTAYGNTIVELDSGDMVGINCIPINLSYQIDVYTRTLEEADEYARNMIFNFVNFPNITITVPYRDTGFSHDSSLRLQNMVDDNSEIPERLIQGQFSRITMTVDVIDAYLFDVRKYGEVTIELENETVVAQESEGTGVTQAEKRVTFIQDGVFEILPDEGYANMEVVTVRVAASTTPTEEKSVTITNNGTTQVVPTSGSAMTKVTVTTDVHPTLNGTVLEFSASDASIEEGVLLT